MLYGNDELFIYLLNKSSYPLLSFLWYETYSLNEKGSILISMYLPLNKVFYKVERYNVKGKNILSSLEKYYAVDIGIRNIKLGRRYSDLGHIIENIVFLELIRRKYEVYIGFIQDGEIDFAAFKNGNIEYYQVTLSLIDKNVMERETKSLKNIHDNYPKYIYNNSIIKTTD